MAFVSCSEDANRISGLWELDHAEDLFRDKLLNWTETVADAVQETLRLDVDGPDGGIFGAGFLYGSDGENPLF